jgi:hypothetical protein
LKKALTAVTVPAAVTSKIGQLDPPSPNSELAAVSP